MPALPAVSDDRRAVPATPDAYVPRSSRRSPWQVAVSIVLIVLLVLPVMNEVFARLLH